MTNKKDQKIQIRLDPKLKAWLKAKAGIYTNGNISEFIRLAIEEFKNKRER